MVQRMIKDVLMRLFYRPFGRRLKVHCANGIVIVGVIEYEMNGFYVLRDGAEVVVEECSEPLQFEFVDRVPGNAIETAYKKITERQPLLPVDAVNYMEVIR